MGARRERNDGLYRPSTYLLFKMVEEMTIFFFLSLVTTSIVFAPCRLGGSFLLFWLVNFITTATGIGAASRSLPCSLRSCSVSAADSLDICTLHRCISRAGGLSRRRCTLFRWEFDSDSDLRCIVEADQAEYFACAAQPSGTS